ncbi:MAG TPA: thiamine pyrophosphate-dependent enzyme [Acidobacteriaceae bacterium]|nr:thiamine pyrophosphate-dependent enzyme [Acidobacteriaceae bacterium]
MPNARLRQIYLAMMQARALAHTLPKKRGQQSTLGLEACLVSPTVDLGSGDLVSDALAGGAVEFLRRPRGIARKSRAQLRVDCGCAGELPGAKGSFERIWTAVGAAAALQRLAAHPKPADDLAAQPGVVVLYLLPEEIPAALLQKVLSFAHDQKLPLLLVVLPPSRIKAGTASTHKARSITDLAHRCGVPAIPTDTDDAVAIYRVAQESIGHARIGGGPALIECVPFALHMSAGKHVATADAITSMEQYMIPRKVITTRWIDSETKAFAKRLTNQKIASN